MSLLVAGHDRSTLSGRDDLLGAERQTPAVAQRAEMAASDVRPERLCGVLNYAHAQPLPARHDVCEIAW